MFGPCCGTRGHYVSLIWWLADHIDGQALLIRCNSIDLVIASEAYLRWLCGCTGQWMNTILLYVCVCVCKEQRFFSRSNSLFIYTDSLYWPKVKNPILSLTHRTRHFFFYLSPHLDLTSITGDAHSLTSSHTRRYTHPENASRMWSSADTHGGPPSR